MVCIDDLDTDLLVHCFELCDARALAAASLVCRRWAQTCQSNSLWYNVLSKGDTWSEIEFAEVQLSRTRSSKLDQISPEDHASTSAFAERTPTLVQPETGIIPACHMPWPQIMRRRHEQHEHPAVIIDAGAGYCKFGWSNEQEPSGRLATFLELGSMESPVIPRITTLFRTIFSELCADPSAQPIVLTEPLHHLEASDTSRSARMQWRNCTLSILFKTFGVPAVCLLNQGSQALYQAHMVSGIVVNIGFRSTTVVPMIKGEMLPGSWGVETVDVAAMRVTGCLHHLMEFSGIQCQNMFTIRALKEKLCAVSPTPLETLSLADDPELYATCDVPRDWGGGTYTLGPQRFIAPEVLFNPTLFGLRSQSVSEGVASSMLKCLGLLQELRSGTASSGCSSLDPHILQSLSASDLEDMLSNVVLCGGTAGLPGLSVRLHNDLRQILPKEVTNGLRVHSNRQGYNVPWVGGRIVAQTSEFSRAWCLTKDQFLTEGCGGTDDPSGPLNRWIVKLNLRR